MGEAIFNRLGQFTRLIARRRAVVITRFNGAQAAFQAGGAYWTRWYEEVKRDLFQLQGRDGSWTDLVGPCYATAMAAIILQLPNQYLPITES